MHKVLLTAATVLIAATMSAGAADVIRGGTLTLTTPAPPPSGFGSSGPIVLRGTLLREQPATPRTPASNLGSDADAPVLDLPCLHTEPPSCR